MIYNITNIDEKSAKIYDNVFMETKLKWIVRSKNMGEE